jgi:alpha-N-arabinofuranosidase
MDELIRRHWDAMGESDRQRHLKLVVDEWGAWYRPGTELAPTHLLGQQSTMRDAVLAGLTLDTFHRHADKVAMANVAQLVNCLQSLFLAREDRFVVTPTFHVFEMYAPHAGGQAVRTEFSAPRISYDRVNGKGSLWSLGGSASVKDRTLTLTVVNTHATEPRETEIAVRGARTASARVRTLATTDVHAHNTFEQPQAVTPADGPTLDAREGVLVHRFPPASVSRLTIQLGAA